MPIDSPRTLPDNRPMVEPNHSTITLCGASIPMKRAGAGPAMLVLHGNGGSPRFLPAMQKLAERFEVFIPQAPGFGGTAVPPWLETIADLANFYLEFLDHSICARSISSACRSAAGRRRSWPSAMRAASPR